MKRRTLLGAAMLGPVTTLSSPAAAQVRQSDIDADARAAMQAGRAPGLALVATVDGETRMSAGYGLASIPFASRVTERTLFHVGSLGKQFTAYAIMQLVEAGAVGLDRSIGEYVEGLPASWRAATVRHLLTHTSGLPEYVGPNFVWDRPVSREALIAGAGEECHFDPGECWSYSNTGYALLGWAIERLSGKSYGAYISERIFAPLGMRDARADDPGAVIEGRAEPYEDIDGAFRHATPMEAGLAASADGGLLLSARDFPRWIREQQGPTLISRAHAEQMRAPVMLRSRRAFPYGMGWQVDHVRSRPVLVHTGEVPGFWAIMVWIQATDTAVFACCNVSSGLARSKLVPLVRGVVERFSPGATAAALQPIPDRSPQRTGQARELLTRGDQAVDPTILAPERRALAGGRLAGQIAPTFEHVRAVEPIEEFSFGGANVRRYRLHFDNGDNFQHVRIAYAPDGRICWVA